MWKKCVITKKKTSIEVISSKTASRSQERDNEGQIIHVLRHVINLKRKHVEHEVTESYRSTKKTCSQKSLCGSNISDSEEGK